MNLLEEIKKDRKKIGVRVRRCNRGPTATDIERNKEICRRKWNGEKFVDMAGDYGITPRAAANIVQNIEKKLEKTGLSRENFLNN